MSEKRREERAVYIISVAAELAGVHPQTLRIYERKGLLRPARTAGNTRRYSERDIDRLRLIQELTQKHGINLAGVKMIMGLQADVDRMRRQLEELHQEVARIRERVLEREAEPRADLVPLRSIRIFPWLKSG
ncbi:MAG TPA: helix-turn-helix transcriptional regulator [Actinomycetota bacterium]|jgi:MerR family transcriptional regulator/heat shock protein HspR|nr:helix-turn-helix transcriptional regulator [Actinomycetota bacterium]